MAWREGRLGSGFNREKLGKLNLQNGERWASALGGAALAAWALKSRSKTGTVGLAALGLPLLWRGATGHCPMYARMGIDRVHGTDEGTSPASRHTSEAASPLPASFDEGRTTRLDERTEGRPVTTTDRQPIGQTF